MHVCFLGYYINAYSILYRSRIKVNSDVLIDQGSRDIASIMQNKLEALEVGVASSVSSC